MDDLWSGIDLELLSQIVDSQEKQTTDGGAFQSFLCGSVTLVQAFTWQLHDTAEISAWCDVTPGPIQLETAGSIVSAVSIST